FPFCKFLDSFHNSHRADSILSRHRDPHPCNREPLESAFAHSSSGFRRTSETNFLFDTAADVRIYRLPIIKSPLKDRAAHATKQCSGNSFNESIAVSIVEDVAHQGAGLAEIIVV